MTDQIDRRKRGSYSSLEVLSVVAMILVLVMVAIPFPYARRDHWVPASRPASGGGSVAASDAGSGDKLPNTGEGNASSVGHASQGSPFEVRTVGKREFCADMPGVVRFRSTGPSCKNGTIITNAQRHREQEARP